MENTYIIGDIHGCIHTLKELVEQIPDGSRIIGVGDLVDKGNHPDEVIDFFIDNNIETVMGNHDYWLMEHLKFKINKQFDKLVSQDWFINPEYYGSETTIKIYEDSDKILKHFNWLKDLPHYIKVDDFFITHGFGIPYYNRKKKSEYQLSLRSNRLKRFRKDWENYENYGIINIFGHDAFEEVIKDKHYIGIDTGCVYGNKLSAINLTDMSVISVNKSKFD